jgi:hypothetical protein
MVNMHSFLHVYHYLGAVCQLKEPFAGTSAPKWGGKVDVMELFARQKVTFWRDHLIFTSFRLFATLTRLSYSY